MEHPDIPEIDQNIKLNSFTRKEKALLLNDEYISLAAKKIRLNDITHFKFGISGLQAGMFVVGRKYEVHIKTTTDRFNLVFRSYFRLNIKYFNQLFHLVINGVWLRTGDRLLSEMIAAVKANQDLKFGHCTVQKTGITFYKNSKNPKKEFFISWQDLSYDKKYDRLVLNSKKDSRRWLNIYYLHTWNAEVLIEFLDWVYKENELIVKPE